MPKARSGRQTVPLEESFQLEALLNVLERKGVIRKEVLEEIKRLKKRQPQGR